MTMRIVGSISAANLPEYRQSSCHPGVFGKAMNCTDYASRRADWDIAVAYFLHMKWEKEFHAGLGLPHAGEQDMVPVSILEHSGGVQAGCVSYASLRDAGCKQP
jgi:hypothetical protein